MMPTLQNSVFGNVPNMLQSSEVAERVATFFKLDIAQTGAKTAVEDGPSGAGAEYGSRFSETYAAVYMDPNNASDDKKDSSSFSVVTKDGFDSLTVRRLRYDENGHYAGLQGIRTFETFLVASGACLF